MILNKFYVKEFKRENYLINFHIMFSISRDKNKWERDSFATFKERKYSFGEEIKSCRKRMDLVAVLEKIASASS